MSTTHPSSEADRIEVLANDNDGTVTFVADRDEESTAPPTEWITIAKGDAVDLNESR
jgi:DNA/RNA endonuclease YhcR with UshA esterase domain